LRPLRNSQANGISHNRQPALSESELISILIAFQTSRFRDFKAFYLFLLAHHRREFPGLLSYRRVLIRIPKNCCARSAPVRFRSGRV